MKKTTAIVIGAGALLALALSLPLEWMTIHNAEVNFGEAFQEFGQAVQGFGNAFQGFGNNMSFEFNNLSVSLNGFNGHITFLVKLPIWLIAGAGLIGALLALLNALRVTSLPRFVPLIFLAVSALYTGIGVSAVVSDARVTAGIGLFVALLGLVLGFVLALARRPGACGGES